jgi:hypothetical protein
MKEIYEIRGREGKVKHLHEDDWLEITCDNDFHTRYPHYGCWNLIGTERPDFHRPEYFGTIVL